MKTIAVLMMSATVSLVILGCKQDTSGICRDGFLYEMDGEVAMPKIGKDGPIRCN